MNNPTTRVRKLNKELGYVKPFRFENWLVLALDPKWEELVGGELVFECSIADGRLQIISTKEVIFNE